MNFIAQKRSLYIFMFTEIEKFKIKKHHKCKRMFAEYSEQAT